MKQRVLEMAAEAETREAELMALCADGPSDLDGRWSAKDHLAHLAWWRARDARLIEAVRTGMEPPGEVADGEAQNAVVYADNRDRSAADVKRDVAASWQALRAAIEACTAEDLARAHPRAPEFQLWEVLPADCGHLGTHLMFWYLDRGDQKHAEVAEMWAYRVESAAFPDPAKRANATYNLACFYSRAGRPADALALLREAFHHKPDLISLARTDPDLDPIRGELELKELLAT